MLRAEKSFPKAGASHQKCKQKIIDHYLTGTDMEAVRFTIG